MKKKLYDGSTETAPDLAYTYNLLGKIASRTDKRGITVYFYYDNLGRPRGVDYPQFDPATETVTAQNYTNLNDFLTNTLAGEDIVAGFDQYGRLSEVEGPTGTSTFTYDSTSARLASEAGPNGTVSYAYTNGEIDKLFTGTDVGTTDYLVDYTVTAGRLAGISSTVNTKQASTAYTYQTGRNIISKRTTTSGTNSLTTDYTYDGADRLTTVNHQNTSLATISQYAYQLDDLGRRTSVTKTGTAYSTSQTINYGYNERGELISATSTSLPDYDFSYDGIGNRTNYQKDQLKVQGTFNSLNQLTTQNYLGTLPYTGTVAASSGNLSTVSVDGTAVSGVSGNSSVTLTGTVTVKGGKKMIVLAEDDQGRKSSTVKDVPNEFTSTYDANGNLKTEANRTYYWNCANRLVRLDITDGEKVMKLEFTYDFMGRRVSKKVYIKQDSGSSFVLQSSYAFLYNGFKLIAKLDAQNSNAVLQKFVWQPEAVGLDIPISVYDAGDNTNYFYLSDANKNIGQVVDSAGSIQAKYEYSPFGRITSQSGTYAETNPFRFSSEYADNESGLVYYNFRYYSPTLGRWLSRDPIGQVGGMNIYAFCRNNPIDKWDYWGLRNIVINIYYNTNKLTPGAMAATEKIYQRCFKKCDKCKKHKVTFKWIPTTKTSKDYKDLKLGFYGGNIFGFYPTEVGIYITEKKSGFTGYNNGWYNSINFDSIRKQFIDAGNLEKGYSLDYVIGIVIAHETGHHGIGGTYGHHSQDSRYIDSAHPPQSPTTDFSDQACQEICDELDIDTGE